MPDTVIKMIDGFAIVTHIPLRANTMAVIQVGDRRIAVDNHGELGEIRVWDSCDDDAMDPLVLCPLYNKVETAEELLAEVLASGQLGDKNLSDRIMKRLSCED